MITTFFSDGFTFCSSAFLLKKGNERLFYRFGVKRTRPQNLFVELSVHGYAGIMTKKDQRVGQSRAVAKSQDGSVSTR